MPDKIRVGLISTSWWADLMYLPALRSHPRAETVAICGRNRKKAEELAAKYNVPQVYVDHREMIQQAGLDAIIVAAPDDLHYSMTLDSLQAGLHVLCEKPLAMNAQQALEMVEKAQAAGVKHMVLFTFRWMPFFRYAHDLIAQGYIGRCYQCDFRMLVGDGREKGYDWRFDRKKSNGVLGDLGSHMVDMARWLVGDITAVNAKLGFFGSRDGLDGQAIDPANDSALLLAEFSNGAQGPIQASAMTHLGDRVMHQQVFLFGEQGSLEINVSYGGAESGAILRGAPRAEKEFKVLEVPDAYWEAASRSDPFSIFTQQPVGVRLFIDSILEDRPIDPNFNDGYKAQQVIDAAIQSHQAGCRVVIDHS